MPSQNRKHAAIFRSIIFVCLFCSGADLDAQTGVPNPADPAKSKEASAHSQLKLQNYQVKHAKAADVLTIWQQLHGGGLNGITVDERTNSIVFLTNDTAAREVLATLALLDSESPSSIVNGPSPEVHVPQKVESAYRQLPFRKFTFKHANAADVFKILQELVGLTKDELDGFAVDERTNSIVFMVDAVRDTHSFEEMCTMLDAESPVSASKLKTPSPYAPTPTSGSPQPVQTFSFYVGFERGESPESLKQRYNELEQQAHQLASKLKQSASLSEAQRIELKLAVHQSFKARQELQRAELADLARRMQSMQQSIDMRDKLADKVVERRVEDLLNPDLQWDEFQTSGPSTGSGITFNNATEKTVSSATEMQVQLQGTWRVTQLIDDFEGASPLDQLLLKLYEPRFHQVVISRGYLIIQLIEQGKVLESATWKLVWPNANQPQEVDIVFEPGRGTDTIPGRISLDGETFQIVFGEQDFGGNTKRPAQVAPGDHLGYIKLVRTNTQSSTAPLLLDTNTSIADPKSIKEAMSRFLSKRPVPVSPHSLAIVGVEYSDPYEAGDLKEEILEQTIALLERSGQFALVSRRIIDATLAESKLKLRDLRSIEQRSEFFSRLTNHRVSADYLLFIELKHAAANNNEMQKRYRVTFELTDKMGQLHWLEYVDVLQGNAPLDSNQKIPQATEVGSSQPIAKAMPNLSTPHELVAAVKEYGRSGSYEDFVTLFSDEGVRDLAGSLLMSAMQLNGSVELGEKQGAEVSTGIDSGVMAVREVLKRWLPQRADAAQLKAVSEGLSMMLNAIGGASPDQSAIQQFAVSMRKSVEGIEDHRMFCVEMMQAYEKLVDKPFDYFGTTEQLEWQTVQFGERGLGTLVNGTTPTTTITLQHANGIWQISSLFNELLNVAKPNTESPSPAQPQHTNSRTVTRRYSVGSFVTDNFFSGKGSYDTKEVYDNYETEIEKSLQDLAKTVTATCTQPPKFVQSLGNSRCLLIGHTEAGHQEIASFMSDIGINNNRIRLRGVAISITQDKAKTLGIELTQRVLLLEEIQKLREFQIEHVMRMDETIQSGARVHVKHSELGLQFPTAARIVPNTTQIQIRMDISGASGGVEYFAPRCQTLSDGQSVILVFGDDLYWLVTADIVRDAIVGATDADNS